MSTWNAGSIYSYISKCSKLTFQEFSFDDSKNNIFLEIAHIPISGIDGEFFLVSQQIRQFQENAKFDWY